MKRLVAVLIVLVAMPGIYAQNITDAVRYSDQNITGSARYRGVGGAFGALGGDLSGLNNNPAGSAIFIDDFASVTLSSGNYDNQTYYFDGITVNEDSDFDINQLGGVFVLDNLNRGIKKLAFAFNYDRTSDFDNGFIASGRSTNSIDTYFLGFAQGIPLDLLQTQSGESISDLYRFLGENESFGAQQAFLGFQGFIIDPVLDDPDNTDYVSNIGNGTFDQEYVYTSFGSNGKATFNAAAQINTQLYLGLNLNAHSFDFDQRTTLFEDNNNAGSQVTSLRFENQLRAFGNGFSFQVGGIYQAAPNVRLGATYDSPTWYTIAEETNQLLVTNGTNGNVIVNPDVINIYEDYRIKTPSKLTGSLAYFFGNRGFLSFDYSYEDFGAIEFRPSNDPFFQDLNVAVSNELQGVSTYKLGGEFVTGNLSLRGGYRFKESPYTNEFTLGNLRGYSLGLGYSFGAIRLDLAYDWATRAGNPQLYEDSAFSNTAFVDNITTNIIATLAFRL